MSAVEVALRFTAAWLAVGLGLFVAAGSLRALRPVPVHGALQRERFPRVLYVLPLLVALALLGAGVAGVVRAVPW